MRLGVHGNPCTAWGAGRERPRVHADVDTNTRVGRRAHRKL